MARNPYTAVNRVLKTIGSTIGTFKQEQLEDALSKVSPEAFLRNYLALSELSLKYKDVLKPEVKETKSNNVIEFFDSSTQQVVKPKKDKKLVETTSPDNFESGEL
jgi:tRNA A37 threonylcarbamoyladenosine dehydratase